MKGKVSDICSKCKHSEGTVEDSYYICGVSHSNGGLYHLMPAEDELYCTAYEEVNMNKVEGKVGDFCLKCKNCKAVTRIHDGKNASIRIIKVECEDPYDGMTKTLDADSDICCSMFEEKKEKESFNLNMPREAIKAIAKLNDVICELEKEKAAHLKEIESLKKSSDSWKERCHKAETDVTTLNSKVEVLNKKIEDLKIYADENKTMYEDLKYWKERCHKAETDVTTLNSKVETLKNKKDKYLKKIIDQQATHYKQCARILDLENLVNKLQSGEYDDILAKDIEIKSLQDKHEAAMTGWKDAIDTNDKMIGEKDKQIEELARRYNMIAKKLNDIHDILKEDPNNA